MKRITVVVSIAAAALFLLRTAPVRADESDELTYFTFSSPVELPGLALPAGTYIFEHPDIDNVDVVQVLSQNGTTVYGTFLTIPVNRTRETYSPAVRFDERATGAPPAIKAWFYPGRMTGDEFIYSHR